MSDDPRDESYRDPMLTGWMADRTGEQRVAVAVFAGYVRLGVAKGEEGPEGKLIALVDLAPETAAQLAQALGDAAERAH